MAVVFQVKGTALDAFYSRQGKEPGIFKKSTDADPAPTAYGDASVFGGQAINFSNASTYPKGLIYPGFRNFSMNQAWTIRMRIVPFWTGLPPATQALFTFARPTDIGNTYPQFYAYIRADGQIDIFCTTVLDGGGGYFAATIPDTVSCTSGVAFEIQISWTGLTGGGANRVLYSRDGANALVVASPTTAWDANNWKWISAFKLGYAPGVMGADCTKYALNELLIFDTAEAQTYTARTAFDSSRSAYDALDNSDPGVANVRSGTAYTFGGAAKTGTAAIPSAANVRSGVATDSTVGTLVAAAAATTKVGTAADDGTGTYDGSDRWSDPGEANVRTGTAYKANSTSNNKTGTLSSPALSDVKIGVAGDGGTGTYDGSDRWSDPGEANVLAGVEYKANSTSNNKTGTYGTSAGTYITDVAQVASEAKFAGTFSSSTLPTLVKVCDIIAEEEAKIEAALKRRYQLPLTEDSSILIVRAIALALVVERVREITQVKTGEEKSSQRPGGTSGDRARKDLQKIIDGDIDLEGETLLSSSDGVKSYAVSQGLTPTMRKDVDQW